MTKKQKLELTWVGKDNLPKLEPRILLEDQSMSYHPSLPDRAETTFNNKLIFGDNLLALKALERDFSGKVKCACIDPPYNTGSAFAYYDDGVEHSLWLTLIRDRLKLFHKLLKDDGSIWICIDDNELHYLKVVCDEIFGRSNFVATMIWEKRKSRENRRAFSFNHDYILVFAKNKQAFENTRNTIELTKEVLSRYKNPDNDPKGPWQSISALAQAGHATANQFYVLETPSGRLLEPPAGNCWRYSKQRMNEFIQENRIWFGKNGDNVPRVKRYQSENPDDGLTPETIWPASEVGTNDEAKKGLIELFPNTSVFENPKPENLIQRILHIATNSGDLVLDSFAGSGTTGAVAHKMGRRWIMIELGEHCHTHIIPRLKKVIDGEDSGGITEAVGWKGGGGFRYYRLAPSLLEKDAWDNLIISKEYNPAMLAEAVCRHMGFTYEPNAEHYWMHGRSSESDFIYVTTAALTSLQLRALSEEVGENRTLLICCKAFTGSADQQANLTLKKIPNAVLRKCEWGRDDYSFNIASVPEAKEPTESDEVDPPEPALKAAPPRKGRPSKVAAGSPSIFDEEAAS